MAMFPAANSHQRAGVPRKKVGLAPGCSQLDWMRLVNSGKNLSGIRRPLQVTPEQLRMHCTEDDAWMAVRGVVYNITPYFKFHPGGVDVLMRGAGADATSLFDEYHPWVNLDGMMKTCVIGTLTKASPEAHLGTKKVRSSSPVTPNTVAGKQKPQVPMFKGGKPGSQQSQRALGSKVAGTGTGSDFVPVHITQADQLNHNCVRIRLKCEGGAIQTWPGQHVRIRCNINRQIVIRDYTPIWPISNQPSDEFDIIVKIYPDGALTPHIQKLVETFHKPAETEKEKEEKEKKEKEKKEKDGEKSGGEGEITKPRSKITINVVESASTKGRLRAQRGQMSVAAPFGHFEFGAVMGEVLSLGVICAGTGVTPFVKIIDKWFAVRGENGALSKLQVLCCNATRNDILLADALQEWKDSGNTTGVDVRLAHLLSKEQVPLEQVSSADKTFFGHLSLDAVKSWMPAVSEEDASKSSSSRPYVLVCGPPRFNAVAVKFLVQSGYKESMFHVFA